MSWESIFADSHFSGASWVLPVGAEVTPTNNQITLAPMQFVTDVEPVGTTFHNLAFPTQNTYDVPVLLEDDIDLEELIDTVREASLRDYYSLLFVQDKGMAATAEDVKKTWKYINVYLHPDKADSSRKVDAEARFKACLKAYETFLDPAARIDYDSSIDFDDSVPGPKAGLASLDDFLKTYGPVFARNARWSKTQPMPLLGDKNSTEEEVAKFYKAWMGFNSWRTFPDADTEKCGDSASRDQRRQADQKNQRQRAAAATKEAARIRGLVTLAEKIDPRALHYKAMKTEVDKTSKQAAFDAKTALAKEKLPKKEMDAKIQEAVDAAVAQVKAKYQEAYKAKYLA